MAKNKIVSYWETPEGKIGDMEFMPEDDAWHPDDHPKYYEWWYFDANFDNGYSMAAMLSTKDISKMHKKTGPRMLLNIATPGKNYQRADYFAVGDFNASQERCDVTLGENVCRGNYPEWHLKGSVKGLEVDLVFRSIELGWKPGRGKFCVGENDEFYSSWVVAVPKASVTGYISVDGQRVEVKGKGYHDHNAGNISMNDVSAYWYWGRISFNEITCIFSDIHLHPLSDMKRIQPFYLAKEGIKLIGQNGFDFVAEEFLEEPTLKVNYPNVLKLGVRNPDLDVNVLLKNKETMTVDNLFGAHREGDNSERDAFLEKYIIPSYLRFRCDSNIEINRGKYSGEGVFEVMNLHRPIDAKYK
jgi:hypothetical protein